MRWIAGLFLAIGLFLSPFVSYAESLLLARETAELSNGLDMDALIQVQATVKRLVDEAKRQPCVEKASKEGRTISMYLKTQTQPGKLIFELWSDDCE